MGWWDVGTSSHIQMRVLDTTPSKSFSTGRCAYVEVGVEAMQTESQLTEPLGLFSGKLKPRLYGSVIRVLWAHHYLYRPGTSRPQRYTNHGDLWAAHMKKK